MFNTSFIPENNVLEAGKMNLSPEDIRKDKDKKIPGDFTLKIFFEDFCKTCSSYDTAIEDLCENCI
jgi:aspartate carbamoyltransferase catalytic subunit